ncbi:MAG: glycoside hydrolase family 57 protein, partial [Candidatus Eisenbacteria bacterium]
LDEPDVRHIAQKTTGFDEKDRDAILDKHLAIMGRVIPAYREALVRGQIEISSSPFFHPILPLLCDAGVARQALPSVQLPQAEIRWPEDALLQMSEAIRYHEKTFGRAPRGLWPSEGGVSDETLALAAKAGFGWAAADEEILARALNLSGGGKREVAAVLYRPYRLQTEHGALSLVFRDKVLSDLVGFTYMNVSPRAAAEDFVLRLRKIGQQSQDSEPLVTVVLDGENCWEFYENDGREFLAALYGALSAEPDIVATTVSEYLEAFPDSTELETVPAGSWIDGNFRIWIGHPEDNAAWDLLARAREALTEYVQSHPESATEEAVQTAWREIHTAEGSDWCWWYGDDHRSLFDCQFDTLFRSHLVRVYELLRLEVPPELYSPIIGARGEAPHAVAVPPAAFVNPTVDGKITQYYEWQLGGYCDLSRGAGSMRQAVTVVNALHYGFDLENLFVRIDTVERPTSPDSAQLTLIFELTSPVRARVLIRLGPEGTQPRGSVETRINSEWRPVQTSLKYALVDVVEFGVPFRELGLEPGASADAILLVTREDMVIESWPAQEKLTLRIPGPESDSTLWSV